MANYTAKKKAETRGRKRKTSGTTSSSTPFGQQLPQYVYTFKKRGKPVCILRDPNLHNGAEIRLDLPPLSPDFWNSYKEAYAGTRLNRKIAREKQVKQIKDSNHGAPGTLKKLFTDYMTDSVFLETLAPSTQKERRSRLDRFAKIPTPKEIRELYSSMGQLPFGKIRHSHLREAHKTLSKTPAEADKTAKDLRAAFRYAIDMDWVETNPADGLPVLTGYSEGHQPWTDQDIEVYRDFHPIGTKARLAIELFLEFGERVSDTRRFGWPLVSQGYLEFTQQKRPNQKSPPVRQSKFIRPQVLELLKQSPTGDLVWLAREDTGGMHSAASLSHKFARWAEQASVFQTNEDGAIRTSDKTGKPLPKTAHGLRKTAAIQLAEAGGSHTEVKNFGGWKRDDQASHYVANANARLLSKSAMEKKSKA